MEHNYVMVDTKKFINIIPVIVMEVPTKLSKSNFAEVAAVKIIFLSLNCKLN